MRKVSKRYDQLVKGYYSKPGKPASLQQSLVITKIFDDGRPIGNEHAATQSIEYDLAFAQETFVEYDLALRPEEGFADYEVVSSHPPVSPEVKSAAQTNDFYVEPFQEMMCPPSGSQPPATAGAQPAGKDENLTEAEKFRKEALESITMPEVPTIGLSSPQQKPSEDDFFADMQSILKGEKQFDPVSKKTVAKDQSLEQPAPQQMPQRKQQEPELPPVETKNEHAIFDKIAQSMQYANAFDLGSFDIEQRFDDFDRIEEISQKSKNIPRQQTYTPPPSPARPAAAGPADFLEDLDLIAREQSARSGMAFSKPEKEIPLDPGVGGRSINIAAMQPGDIIISTTESEISGRIRKATGSQVSHASIYLGEGNLIEAVDDGVMQFSVDTSIADDSVAVAYRHKDITPEKARLIVQFLQDAKNKKLRFDYYGLVRVAPYQLVSSYCDTLPESLRASCRTSAERFKLGTDNNNEFYCSELVFAAFRSAGLNISDVDPHWSSPQDVVRLNHNGTLQYVGHLKA